jgi:hypothetical protein
MVGTLLSVICIFAVLVACREFVLKRRADMDAYLRQNYAFGNSVEVVKSCALSVPRGNLARFSWYDIARDCGVALKDTNVSHADNPNPFNLKCLDDCQFGRTRVLCHEIPANETPLIWGLSEFPKGFQTGDTNDPVVGKTIVAFWNGEVRFMSLSNLYSDLRSLHEQYPKAKLEVLDHWDEGGRPLWRTNN